MESTYPKQIILKDGRKVQVRPMESRDEEALIRFFSLLPREATEFLKDNVREPEVIRRWVREPDPERVWAILALDEQGNIVADATLHMDRYGWRRHVGEVRVVVAPDYHRSGLARGLIHDLVNHASMIKLKKLEAQVLVSQIGARTAFEHLGFREEARLKDHALDLDHRLHDLVILTNTVEDLWSRMENLLTDLDLTRDGY